MAAEKPNRAQVAGKFEDGAAEMLEQVTGQTTIERSTALAQVFAILALGQRVADLTDRLEAALAEAFGDDSNLDRLQREVRDGLEAIRSDGIGVG